MAVVVPDVPLIGMVKDRLGKKLVRGEATDLLNTWRESGELRARPGLSQLADIPDTKPVQNLFTAEFADESRSTIRVDEDDAYNLASGAWTIIAASTPDFSGNATSPFGMAMVFNNMIISNGVLSDGVYRWTGAGNLIDLNTEANVAGTDEILLLHAAFRYVVPFAGRVIGAFTSATNGANSLIGSAIGSVTDWTSANGAFITIRNEHPSPITQLTADENTLIVWKERAIILGTETGDSAAPIFFQLVRTPGLGAIASRSVLSYGGFYAALGHEGFYSLIGGQPNFIDEDIRRDFFRRLNYSALRQVHGVAMPEYGKFLWFIPEGNDTYPRNAWIYDTITRGWERWELGAPITASERAFISTGLVADSYGGSSTFPETDTPGAIADVTGGNALIDTGLISGTLIDDLGSPATAPSYILGNDVGVTFNLDFAASDDDGTPFGFTWESPDVRWEGLVDETTGTPIGPRDVVTLDEVRLEYNHSGASARLECSVSTDGGQSYTVLTIEGDSAATISTTSDLYTSLSFWTRTSGNQIRVRLRITQIMGFPKFRNLTLYGLRAGERR